MSNLVPDQLHLKNADQTQTVDIFIPGGGENKIQSSGSLSVECPQTLIMKGYDVYAQPSGNFGIANSTFTNIYRFPNPNSNQPQQGQVIQFNSDGTSQFATVGGGGGGNFSTPSNQALDMNGNLINNVLSLNMVNGADTIDVKPFNPDAGAATIQASAPLAIIGAQSMYVGCNGGPLQLSSNVALRCIVNGSQLYDFPISRPSQGQFLVAGYQPNPGAAVPLDFQTFNIPVAPAGSSFVYSPANANFNLNNYALTGASNVSSANYNLEDVGALSDQNATDIATLQAQVASLITIINNLTGIQV